MLAESPSKIWRRKRPQYSMATKGIVSPWLLIVHVTKGDCIPLAVDCWVPICKQEFLQFKNPVLEFRMFPRLKESFGIFACSVMHNFQRLAPLMYGSGFSKFLHDIVYRIPSSITCHTCIYIVENNHQEQVVERNDICHVVLTGICFCS